MEWQWWPKKAFNRGSSGTQYVAMVTELSSSYWRTHLVESYCKESNISDTNWLRYPFLSYLINIWLRVWRHHLANLHILKTWVSLERKAIFENSKQHLSAHEVYLFMFHFQQHCVLLRHEFGQKLVNILDTLINILEANYHCQWNNLLHVGSCSYIKYDLGIHVTRLLHFITIFYI